MKFLVILVFIFIFNINVYANSDNYYQTLSTLEVELTENFEDVSTKITEYTELIDKISNEISLNLLEIEDISNQISSIKEQYDNLLENFRENLFYISLINIGSNSEYLNSQTLILQNLKIEEEKLTEELNILVNKNEENENYIITLTEELEYLYIQYEKIDLNLSEVSEEYAVLSLSTEFYKYDEFSPIWPIPDFGTEWITNYYSTVHLGIDIAAYYGTPVIAASDGVVISAEYHWSWGNNVYIEHNDIYSTRYAHLSSMTVEVGDYVNAGDVIGYIGSTGNSTGNHLHFEIYENGSRVDPYNFLF